MSDRQVRARRLIYLRAQLGHQMRALREIARRIERDTCTPEQRNQIAGMQEYARELEREMRTL